jgi:hypothetical protein
MVGSLLALRVFLVPADDATLHLRGGVRLSVQLVAADADGLQVQQGLSIQRLDWDQIHRIEGLSQTSKHQPAIEAWLPHAELLWRFRSRLERRDFQGAARLAPELTKWQDHPSRVGLLVREGLFQIALAGGNLAAAVPHLLAFGDRLVVDGATDSGSRLGTPVSEVLRLHPDFPPIVPPGPEVQVAREALKRLPPPVDPLSVWLRAAWDVVLARAEGEVQPFPVWDDASTVPPTVEVFLACELGVDGGGLPAGFELWSNFADRSPSRRAVLARVEVLARGAASPMADLAGWQAVEMLKAMSLPAEADRLLEHLRRVDANALSSSLNQGSS